MTIAQPLLVQGKIADIPEFLIAQALDTLRLRFLFQYTPYGIPGVRGTPRIDFLVFTPRSIPVEYDGKWWHRHRADNDEQMQRRLIADYFGVAEVTVITGDEITSTTPMDKVISVVRHKLM
jgi:hypothetical protein